MARVTRRTVDDDCAAVSYGAARKYPALRLGDHALHLGVARRTTHKDW